MRWIGGRESSNVDDRRGLSTGGGVAIGGGIIGVIFLVVKLLLGGGNGSDQVQLPGQGQEMSAEEKAADDQRAKFVRVVLAYTEDVWDSLFTVQGKQYVKPTLVLFRNSVQSACGMASSATGPFYCPGDQEVYIDLSFYQELEDRFQAPGDFAEAYVIAHEVGHHVQDLTGTLDQAHNLQARSGETEGNAIQVKVELQADCYAGVWAKNAKDPEGRPVMEQGDFEEGMR